MLSTFKKPQSCAPSIDCSLKPTAHFLHLCHIEADQMSQRMLSSSELPLQISKELLSQM
jgi:hypothetical protein